MSAAVLGQIDWWTIGQSPFTWALAIPIGFWITLSSSDHRFVRLGQLVTTIGLMILAFALPKLSALSDFNQWATQITFWILAGVAIGCSAAAVTSRNPVYTAIWFAGSLLGVAGLFLFQNAQFLGFATIVVYAGAIVVTFLFVLMLANPEGNANYDRISWASFPAPLTILGSTAFVLIIAVSFFRQPPIPMEAVKPNESEHHVALLGGELFAKHLVSVEVAGTILLIALVGAIAIVIQSKGQTEAPSVSDAASRRETS